MKQELVQTKSLRFLLEVMFPIATQPVKQETSLDFQKIMTNYYELEFIVQEGKVHLNFYKNCCRSELLSS